MLALSRGWQMRNPLHVRVEELVRALRGEQPHAAEVFAPGADFFFSWHSKDHGSDLPAPLASVSAELTNALTLYDTIIDTQAIDDPGGVGAKAAESQAELAERLRAHGAQRELARRVVDTRFILDMKDDLARAGLSLGLLPDELLDRLADNDRIARMPFLARMRELIYQRVRNVGQGWQGNDLIDSMFLSCAAGYADVVVGERATIGYLRQSRVVPAGARLATTLAEAAALLDTVR